MGVDDSGVRQNRLLWGRLRESAHLAGLALRLAWHASPGMLVALVVLLGVQAALSPVQLALTSGLIDAAARQLGAESTVAGVGLPFWAWIGMLAAALALGQLIQPLSRTFQSLVGDRVVGHVTGELIRATNRWHGLARVEDPSFADDLDRAGKYAARSGLEIVTYGARTLLLLCTAVGLAGVLAGLHPLAPAVVIVASVPAVARTYEFRMNTGSKIYAQTPDARMLSYFRSVMISPEQAKDVRLYGPGRYFRSRYDHVFERTVGDLDRTRWQLTWPMSGTAALAAAASGAVFGYAVWRVTTGEATVGDLVLYGGAAAALQNTLAGLGFDIGFLPLVFTFLPSLDRILRAPPDLPAAADPCPAPRPIRTGIVFENVSFRYPGRSEPVLDGLNLRLHPGESLALVGANGSGKTTIVKLMLRLYDPTGGRILLDGRDLRDYDLADLRREMGVLFQDFLHYEFTARENIGFGRLGELRNQEVLTSAAERSGAAEVLDRLPAGLDTQLGAQFGGRELSGGEWQKLALARAFARESQVLVLDEPTAALDPQTEYDIFERFADLTRGRMTLLVSHRFSTVRMADRIVVLAGGQVREDGSHEELTEAAGEYARLYRLQAAQYLGQDLADDLGERLGEGLEQDLDSDPDPRTEVS
jgi:ATP-binding cassette, subfamily B, bacterial